MSKEARISSHEMTQYRERLMSQKEFLTDILSKIDKQILALQVCKNSNTKQFNDIQAKCFDFIKISQLIL